MYYNQQIIDKNSSALNVLTGLSIIPNVRLIALAIDKEELGSNVSIGITKSLT